jgi:hypothetical protein
MLSLAFIIHIQAVTGSYRNCRHRVGCRDHRREHFGADSRPLDGRFRGAQESSVRRNRADLKRDARNGLGAARAAAVDPAGLRWLA